MTRKLRPFTAVLVLISLAPFSATAEPSLEAMARGADSVALQSQESAISKLSQLVKKYQNTEKEADLLYRLSESYEHSSQIDFRVAHARAHSQKKDPDLSKYDFHLKSLITATDRLLSRFPNFRKRDLVHYLRGSAFKELKQKDKARHEFLIIDETYSESVKVSSARMELADGYIEDSKHENAITYLKKVAQDPADRYYPYALYKMAWSLNNLKRTEEALSSLEKQIRHYDQKKIKEIELSPADVTFRETALLDSASFYFEGIEKALSSYTVKNAMTHFRKLEPNLFRGRMNLRLAQLLRSRRMEEHLRELEKIAINEELEHPETLEIIALIAEHYFDRRAFEESAGVMKDVLALIEKKKELALTPSFIKTSQYISNSSEKIRETAIRAKNTSEKDRYLKLMLLYSEITLKLVSDTDIKWAKLNYNLAESLFALEEFKLATLTYLKVIDFQSKKSSKEIPKEMRDVKLKAISSRVEELRASLVIPKEVKAVAYSSLGEVLSPKNRDRKLVSIKPKELSELSQWIDEALSHKLAAFKDLEAFSFDVSRALYSSGQLEAAILRLKNLIEKEPDSKFTLASATLMIDTAIQSALWKDLNSLINQYLKLKPFQTGSFHDRLVSLQEDTLSKLQEMALKEKNYDDVAEYASQARLKKTKRAPEMLLVSVQASLERKQKLKALEGLTQIINDYPDSVAAQSARGERAKIFESIFDFDQALKDYEKIKTEKKEVSNQLKEKISFYRWLNGEEFKNCDSVDCEKFEALGILNRKSSESKNSSFENEIELAKTADKSIRPIYALIALQASLNLEFRERLVLIRQIANYWELLDPLTQFVVLPHLITTLPKAWSHVRISFPKAVPLKNITEKTLVRKLEWIKEIENTASKSLKLPGLAMQKQTLGELALIYGDLAETLKTAKLEDSLTAEERTQYQKTLAELTSPFEKKAAEILKQAASLTVKSSSAESVVLKEKLKKSDSVYLVIAKLLPEKASGYKGSLEQLKKKALESSELPTEYLIKLWITACEKQSYSQAMVILQTLTKESNLKGEILAFMRAFTLNAVGASEEASREFESIKEFL